MNRLRLIDLRLSRLPTVVGDCINNMPRLADVVNGAQRRLLYAREAGDESWWGTWAEMIFNVDPNNPYITCPREVARLEAINVCQRPVPIQNQFYEYLTYGNGRLPKDHMGCPNVLQAYSRNNVPTFVDMTGTGQQLQIYPLDPNDNGKQVFIQGTDSADNKIFTQKIFQRVEGIFVTLATPFAAPPVTFNSITGIQKDSTLGSVRILQANPDTGDTTLLLTMEPSEKVASYRRYYLDSLPLNCCGGNGTTTTVQVHAIAKLEFIPVAVDTDYCLIQNMEAIIEEAQSMRYSEIDTPSAKAMAVAHHRQAIALLNGELTHYLGTEEPAILSKPFGSADLRFRKVGTLV